MERKDIHKERRRGAWHHARQTLKKPIGKSVEDRTPKTVDSKPLRPSPLLILPYVADAENRLWPFPFTATSINYYSACSVVQSTLLSPTCTGTPILAFG